MSSHFRWYGSDSEVTVPFNATYSYPSQSNKAVKTVPRLPPKNASEFLPGQEIRIEFPAQGYMNGSNSFLTFDVDLKYTVATDDRSFIRFQNGIQSIFHRVRLMYGSTPLEDVDDYHLLNRALVEHTATGQNASADQVSILEGVGKVTSGASGDFKTNHNSPGANNGRVYVNRGMINTRQALIQGISLQTQAEVVGGTTTEQAWHKVWQSHGWGVVPATNIFPSTDIVTGSQLVSTRRYSVQLNLGLLLQGKLLPLKYMASQLAISITLSPAAECIYYGKGVIQTFSAVTTLASEASVSSVDPTYVVRNVAYIPEILEFDSSYDAEFLKGLQQGGVPIKFASWHNFTAASARGTSQVITIPERNRSIKAAFAMQVRDPGTITTDSGAMFYSTATTPSTLQEYQYRIGARYFPASPVQCSTVVGGSVSNGASEAYAELAKALNIVGDYRLSTSATPITFAIGMGRTINLVTGALVTKLPEYDGSYSITQYDGSGCALLFETETPYFNTGSVPDAKFARARAFAGNYQTACFLAAVDLETSNGMEISGLNAQEQSDIHLIMRWSAPQGDGFTFKVFTYYDAMLVLHENNVVELIE